MLIKSYKINAKGALSTVKIIKIQIDKDLKTFPFKKKNMITVVQRYCKYISIDTNQKLNILI